MKRTIKEKEYYLGLDMGTSSVGWAVTDLQYNLLRAKGKDLWGIREFEEAKTAEDRRMKRVSRRRRQREVVRRGLVTDMFHDALAAKDPSFLQRLENSKYHLEDKDEEVRCKYGIFNDPGFTDKEYFQKYPTIFHLRRELIRNPEAHDVRLVYLAVLNLFKRRGHFLSAGLETETARTMKSVFDEFLQALELVKETSEGDLPVDFSEYGDPERLEEILGSRDISRTEKAEQLQDLFHVEKKQKQSIALIKLICGLKVDLKSLFGNLPEEDMKKICFASASDEEDVAELEETLEETQMDLLQTAKAVYDTGLLSSIMKGYEYLSDARVADYEKHGKNLRILKNLIRKYRTREDYDRMFREDGPGSYSAYVNSTNTGEKKKRRNLKSRSREDLYKAIGTLLKGIPEDEEEAAYIRREIATETFLPKQLTASNGVIPNQVHYIELKKILENASAYLPFLNETDESGLSAKDRILKLFAFQIPYYVGPVTERSEAAGGNGWVVRKEPGEVLPWNIEEKIDLNKTRERFIERLIRECTYISGEKVLPKSSLKYERYAVLNEINNLRIDGEKISAKLKQEIYHDLFETGKKVTRKRLVRYLKNRGLLEEDAQVSGIDQTINNSLSSWGKFQAVFGDRIREDEYRDMAEDIIFWGTVYGEDKTALHKLITDKYGQELTTEQIKRVSGFKFRDWGRLSDAFLQLQGCNKGTGEVMSLLEALWCDEENANLMELINSDRYTFGEELERKRGRQIGLLSEFTPEDLQEMYFSAPVRRMIWQTLLIIEELKKILGSYPKRIFLEMTRTDEEKGDKGRKDSRKDQLQKLYKAIRSEDSAWKKEMLSRIEEEADSGRLRSKKLYLYFTQMGRCMYTGRPIELSDLFDNNLYDIDHIYPQHYVKDDNLNNNMVLVYKPANAHKSDTYPIESSIRHNPQVYGLWKKLLDNKLITEEKYRRLTGARPFTDDQLAGFIARQMVETSQGTKGVADLIRRLLPGETEIVYAKARNVSDFRRDRGFLKSRSVNDFHHAHDAYLNIVVGNVYRVKFTRDPWNFIKEFRQNKKGTYYHMDKMFDWDVRRGNETAWIAEGENGPGTIATVRKTLNRNTPLLTRMSFIVRGGIADETLYGAEKATPEMYIPLKSSDPRLADVTKYGGFNKARAAYFFLVEHGEEGKRIRTLETVPIYKREALEESEDTLTRYCREELGLVDPSVRVPKIRMQTLMKRNGYFVHLSGKTESRLVVRNAVSLCLRLQWRNYVHDIDKYIEHGIVKDSISKTKNHELYEELRRKHEQNIYKLRPTPIGRILREGQELFEKLPLEEQMQVLSQIIQTTKIGSASGNLKMIGGATRSGVMVVSKKISGCDEFKLIHQSVTGVYEKTIDLLTV